VGPIDSKKRALADKKDTQEPIPARRRPWWVSLHEWASWVILPILLIVLWQVAGTYWIDRPLTPTPLGVIESTQELIGRRLLFEAVILSLQRVFLGFLAAVVVGVVIGILMGSSRYIANWLDPLIESLRPIPPIAWVPLAILWFGIGIEAPVFIVAYTAVFPIIINTVAAVHGLDRRFIEAARTLGANRRTILTEVILPGSLPFIMVGIRIGMGAAWMSIVAAELVIGAQISDRGISAGLGQLMYLFFSHDPNMNMVVTCMLAVGVVALIIDIVLQKLHGAVVHGE
jgi:ABC-type nitrate/sulfonate/bicarbonate transport system permease component